MFPTTERAHGSFGQLLKLGFDTILCLNWLFIGKSFKILSPSRAWQLNPPELFFFSAGLAISFAPFYHRHFCNMIGRHMYIASAKFSLWHENRLQIDKTRRVATLRIVQTETSSARWRFNPSTWRVYTWQPFLDQENYVDFSTTMTPPVKASNFPCQDWMIQGSADPASHCLPNMVGLRMFPFETSATSMQILLSTCQ